MKEKIEELIDWLIWNKVWANIVRELDRKGIGLRNDKMKKNEKYKVFAKRMQKMYVAKTKRRWKLGKWLSINIEKTGCKKNKFDW